MHALAAATGALSRKFDPKAFSIVDDIPSVPAESARLARRSLRELSNTFLLGQSTRPRVDAPNRLAARAATVDRLSDRCRITPRLGGRRPWLIPSSLSSSLYTTRKIGSPRPSKASCCKRSRRSRWRSSWSTMAQPTAASRLHATCSLKPGVSIKFSRWIAIAARARLEMPDGTNPRPLDTIP